jgi:hypothetical protein
VDFPAIIWANGLVMARPAGSAERFGGLVGFFTEVGSDQDLDAAMETAQVAPIEVRHARAGEESVVKQHWFLGETIRVFPVTQGPPAPTVGGCLSRGNWDTTIASGIGIRWPQGGVSSVAIVGYLEILTRVGYLQPVKLTARSRMSDWLIAALDDHLRVAKAADAIVDRNAHPEPVDLLEIAWVLGAGDEVSFGTSQTRMVVPLVSKHPKEVDRAYMRTVYLSHNDHGTAVREQAEQDWPGILAWAERVATGNGDGAPHEPSGAATDDAGTDSDGVTATSVSGTLTAEPEMRFTGQGSPVTTFRVTTSRRSWKVVTWDDLAQQCNDVLQEGAAVRCVGAWKDREHNGHRWTELRAREVTSIDGTPLGSDIDAVVEDAVAEDEVPF